MNLGNTDFFFPTVDEQERTKRRKVHENGFNVKWCIVVVE